MNDQEETPIEIQAREHQLARYTVRKISRVKRCAMRLTLWAWRPVMNMAIMRMHERGLITSSVLHEAKAFNDYLFVHL
jgi:hypothetical protein